MSKHYSLGLLGHPVGHSLSPALHNAALAHHKLEGEYRLVDVEASDLGETLDQLEADGVRGVNVTIPHKQAVIKFLQELSPEAAAIGAVNTIVFERNGKTPSRRGENTDVHGFCTALVEAFASASRSLEDATAGDALLLGYGGAARAVVAGLKRLGFSTIKVAGRNAPVIDAFCVTCQAAASQLPVEPRLDFEVRIEPLEPYTSMSLSNVSVAVNATPIGQLGEPIPQEVLDVLSKLPKRCFVYDLVYSRTKDSTPLVETCVGLGLEASEGSGMLVHQAAKSFELWTGHDGSVEVMRAALLGV
jgi:Shikimate 5-dehydrogenase